MIKKAIKNIRGSVLLVTLLIITSILTISLAAANIVTNNILMGRTQIDSSKAFYAAEVGAERILRSIRMEGFDTGSCDSATNKYADFTTKTCVSNKVTYTLPNQANYYVQFISANTYRSFGSSASGVRRTLEVSYN